MEKLLINFKVIKRKIIKFRVSHIKLDEDGIPDLMVKFDRTCF